MRNNNIFFVSDLHFYHHNILTYSNRPFANREEMNEQMIKNWNEIVKPYDEVYHLGDFAFAKFNDVNNILRRLNGFIHMILGNHDDVIIDNKSFLLSGQTNIQSIQDYKELKFNGNLFVLFHYGQRIWRNSHRGAFHLYGHSHGTLASFGRSVDVGVDCTEIHGNAKTDYRPIHIDEIVSFMNKRDFVSVDHHGNNKE